VIQPGVGSTLSGASSTTLTERNTTTTDTLLDLVRNMFPPNLIEATTFQYRTKLTPRNDSDTDTLNFIIGTEIIQTTNILGLVVASAAIGIALGQMGEETRTMANFFHNLLAMMMRITSWVIQLSPLGILFLVCKEIMGMEDMEDVVKSLGKYFGTVILGLSIQGFVVLPLLYFALTKQNPFTFIMHLGQAITPLLERHQALPLYRLQLGAWNKTWVSTQE